MLVTTEQNIHDYTEQASPLPIDWQARALDAEKRIHALLDLHADLDAQTDRAKEYDKGYLHGIQEAVCILCGET